MTPNQLPSCYSRIGTYCLLQLTGRITTNVLKRGGEYYYQLSYSTYAAVNIICYRKHILLNLYILINKCGTIIFIINYFTTIPMIS